jgi:dihydroorotate dehydrogenase electron transfer subunit
MGHPVRGVQGALDPERLQVLPDSGDRMEPKVIRAEVAANRSISDDVNVLTLHCPEIASGCLPGQFLMVTIAREGEPLPALPRPMAVCDWSASTGTIDVGYRIVGSGTRVMAGWGIGERMTIVGPLGRGFALAANAERILILGRGIGSCSLTALAKRARRQGVDVIAVDSARSEDAHFGTSYYTSAGIQSQLVVNDADGSSEIGLVRRAVLNLVVRRRVDQVFACGSARLADLASEIAIEYEAQAQVSIEAHMACGLGFCHGCATTNAEGSESPLVCVDGPEQWGRHVLKWKSTSDRSDLRIP